MKQFLTIFCAMVAGVSTLSATIVATTEAAGVQSTTVTGTTTVNFNNLSAGALGTYVSSIGTYSTGAEIVAPNQFGGAGQTNYISVGAQSGTLSYSLTFASPQSFFGLDWQAMDSGNELDFFNGATEVGSFTAANFSGLSGAYKGNPNTGQDSGEFFVYVDFRSNSTATNFNKVVFKNVDESTGFETDNHSILATGVPEPSTAALLFAGLGGIAIGALRRRRSNQPQR